MEKIKTAVKNKNIGHMYFFLGEEVYLSDYYINRVRELLLSDASFDLSVFESEDISGLQAAVESVPVLNARKLVLVKGLDLTAELKAADVSFLTELLESVPAFTCLIFVSRTAKKTTKLYKLLQEKCILCNFDRQKPAEVIRWAANVAKSQGYMLDRDNAALLIEHAGTDMTTLMTELEKLFAYCIADKNITAAAIEAVVIKSVDAKIYYLLDAIFGGNAEQVFLILEELKAENEKPIYINASIMGTIRTLLEHAYLLKEGKTQAYISDKLRLRPIQAKKNAGYLKRINALTLEYMLRRCMDLDMRLKRGADGFSGLSLIVGELLLKCKK